LTPLDNDLLDEIESGFQTVADELEAVHLRAALAEAMRLASEVNRYLDMTALGRGSKRTKQPPVGRSTQR